MNEDQHDRPPYLTARKQYAMHRKEPGMKHYSDRVIAPLAAWVHAHRGALQEVVRRVQTYTGTTIHVRTIARILDLNPEKRTEPSYGMGRVLVRVIRSMRSEYVRGIAPPYTTGPLQIDTASLVSGNQKSAPTVSLKERKPSGFSPFKVRH